MKRLIIDPFSGISGDMLLSALFDLGADPAVVEQQVRRVDLVPEGTQIVTERTTRGAFAAVRSIVLDSNGAEIDRLSHSHLQGTNVEGSTAYHHDHSHHAPDDRDHGHHHHHHHHVHHSEIVASIKRSDLPDRVRDRSLAIFAAIAKGEGQVHGVDPDYVHFHEVGAVDSIVDIVGIAVALEELDIDVISCGPVPIASGGSTRSQHGVIPLPAPATVAILEGWDVTILPVERELTTPTGAGIVVGLCEPIGEPTGRVVATGFGAGSRNPSDRANVLRATLIEETSAAATGVDAPERRNLLLIETNCDDMIPESWPLLFDRLFEEGALDVWMTQTIMKKGRPGILLSVLCDPIDSDRLMTTIFAETTTIGIRTSNIERHALPRSDRTIETSFGEVRCKEIARGEEVSIVPESDEIVRLSRTADLPYEEVRRRLTIELARAIEKRPR